MRIAERIGGRKQRSMRGGIRWMKRGMGGRKRRTMRGGGKGGRRRSMRGGQTVPAVYD